MRPRDATPTRSPARPGWAFVTRAHDAAVIYGQRYCDAHGLPYTPPNTEPPTKEPT